MRNFHYYVIILICVLALHLFYRQTLKKSSVSETNSPHTQNIDSIQLGFLNLTTKSYSAPFITQFLFENLYITWDQKSRELASKASPPARRKMIIDRYGLLEAPFDRDNIPLGFNKRPDGTWGMSCFLCHAGLLNNRVILGLGNNQIDLMNLSLDIQKLRKGQLLKKWEGPSMPPHVYSALVGNNIFKGTTHSGLVTPLLLALRDRDLNFRTQPSSMGSIALFPDDTPVWWNVWRKKRSFAVNNFEFSHRSLMLSIITPEVSKNQIYESENDFKDIKVWIESLRAETSIEKFPAPLDSMKVARGKKIFNKQCTKCHGTYSQPNTTYPERVIPIQKLGTDPLALEGYTTEFIKAYSESWFGFYKGNSQKTNGYVAPPLDGIWATAPYLHNGSIPTLAHLLQIEDRPQIWKTKQYNNIDLKNVGVEIEIHNVIPSNLTPFELLKFYNTTAPGARNSGHNYAKELSSKEKWDLLEYLKTL